MYKRLIILFVVVAVVASRGLWSCSNGVDDINDAVADASQLADNIALHLIVRNQCEDYGRHLQALWALRYFMLVSKGMVNPLDAARFGRNAIEQDLKRELAMVPRKFAAELYKDLKPFVQRTVELLVQTNQLEVAQVLARGFADGAGFYFV